MIKVYVKKQSNYPVSVPNLKKRLQNFLEKEGIASDADVSVSLVGDKKMKRISKSYLGKSQVHNVLTFANLENSEFVYPPDNIIHLGDIVVCFPEAVSEAKRQGILIEEKVGELLEHGARHLLGKHHQ